MCHFWHKVQMLQTLTALCFFSSCLLVRICECCIGEKAKCSSAYWGKWTFEMTEGDFGLSATADALELSEGALGWQWSATCMQTVRQSVHLEQYGVICWGGLSHGGSTASNSIAADSKIKHTPTHMPKGGVTSTPLYYSWTVTSYYFDAFSFQLTYLYWSTKQKAFKSYRSTDELKGSCQRRHFR